jgi:hypothetical protein
MGTPGNQLCYPDIVSIQSVQNTIETLNVGTPRNRMWALPVLCPGIVWKGPWAANVTFGPMMHCADIAQTVCSGRRTASELKMEPPGVD